MLLFFISLCSCSNYVVLQHDRFEETSERDGAAADVEMEEDEEEDFHYEMEEDVA